MNCAVRLLCALCIAGAACTEKPPAPPRNHCRADKDCTTTAHCDATRALCAVGTVAVPYPIAIQVTTQGEKSGGVRRHTFDPFMLTGSHDDLTLNVPPGLSVPGFIGATRMGEPEAVPAQLAFTPLAKQDGLPVSAVTASSRDALDGIGSNVRLTLTPRTRYRVTVFPLGTASTRFPPATLELNTDGENQFSFTYPDLQVFRAVFLDEAGSPLTGHWVRIIDASDETVLSSIGVVGDTGEVTLFVYPDVLPGNEYRFEVDLDPLHTRETVMLVAPDHLEVADGVTVRLPVIPRFVRFRGTVEKSADVRLSSADLTFVSDFPIPDVPGEVGNRDFCRSSVPMDMRSALVCRSVRRGTTDQDGRFSVELLPGDYRVFLSPTRDGENVNRATTQSATAVIETQAGDTPQQGQVYVLDTGSRYSGAVRSPHGVPLGDVLVRAVALGVAGDLGEVASYNRSSETVTTDNGSFKLAVDAGFYDLVARPAVASGFPWVYMPNQRVNVQDETLDITGFSLATPVLIAGSVTSEGTPEAHATVDAFAMVQGDGGRRAVHIGETTTDAMGRYSLLLPPGVDSKTGPDHPADASSE